MSECLTVTANQQATELSSGLAFVQTSVGTQAPSFIFLLEANEEGHQQEYQLFVGELTGSCPGTSKGNKELADVHVQLLMVLF